MKRYFTFALIFGLFASASVVSGGQKAPSAYLPTDQFEFAPVLEGVQIQHTFAIRNRGKRQLNIIKVRTD